MPTANIIEAPAAQRMAHWLASLGNFTAMQNLRSFPDFLNQNLHFGSPDDLYAYYDMRSAAVDQTLHSAGNEASEGSIPSPVPPG